MKSVLRSALVVLLVGPSCAELWAGGDDPVDTLLKQLQSENAKSRVAAAKALSDMRQKAKAAVPALIEAVEDKDNDVRYNALSALAMIAPDDKTVMLTAMEVLGDLEEAKEVRFIAARLFSFSGPQARAAIPTLIWALSDKDPNVRVAAVMALRDVGPRAKIAVPALTALMENEKSPSLLRDQLELTLKKLQEP